MEILGDLKRFSRVVPPYLNEMIQKKFGNANVSPFWMNKKKSDVSFGMADIWQQKRKSNHELTIKSDASEVGMFEGLRN